MLYRPRVCPMCKANPLPPSASRSVEPHDRAEQATASGDSSEAAALASEASEASGDSSEAAALALEASEASKDNLEPDLEAACPEGQSVTDGRASRAAEDGTGAES